MLEPSTRTPGPIVDDTETLLTYLPLAATGFAFTTLDASAFAFSTSRSEAKEAFPIGACTTPRLVDAILDLAGLNLGDRLVDVDGHRSRLRVRHETAGTEHPPELADRPHHVRRCDHGVEIYPPALNLLDELVATHDVGTGRLGFRLLVGVGDHDDALGRAESMRQHDGATHHLVGVLRVDAQPHHELDRFVELRELDTLHETDGLAELVEPILDLGGRVFEVLAVLPHAVLPVTLRRRYPWTVPCRRPSRPPHRATRRSGPAS